MRGIAEQRHATVHPARIRDDVVHVTTLHVLGSRALEALHHSRGPALEAVDEHLAIVFPLFALGKLIVTTRGHLQEGVILLFSVSDVRRDEVLLRSEEYLVANLVRIGVFGFSVRLRVLAHRRVHGVSGVCERRVLRIASAHLRAKLGSNAVGADQHVSGEFSAIRERRHHLVAAVLVLFHHRAHLNVFLAHASG